MEEFFILLLLVLVIISFVVASNGDSKLLERIKQLGKTAAEKDNALLERIKRGEGEIEMLRQRVEALSLRYGVGAEHGGTSPAHPPADFIAKTETIATEPPAIAADAEDIPTEHTAAQECTPERDAIPAAAASAAPPQHSPRPKPKKQRSAGELEALIGGKLLNRIGALAVILGIGFFLKYAFDNNMVPEWVRVLIGAAAGGALLWGGARFHRKGLPVFAQGLIGAGIAALYISVYASFNFYHLVPQIAAFGLMIGVTILGFFLALRHYSPGVAGLSWAGGFLTPFLLSTGEVNAPRLLTYLALLDVGMVALVVYRPKWFIFEPMSFVATWLLWAAWIDAGYRDADLAVALFFAVVFWVIFAGAEFLRQILRVEGYRSPRILFGGFVTAALYFSLNSTVRFTSELALNTRTGQHILAIMLAVAATIYLISTVRLVRSGRMERNYEAPGILSVVVLSALAAGHEFLEFWRIIAWSGLAVTAVWFGAAHRQNYLAVAGVALLGFSFVWLLNIHDAMIFSGGREYVPVLNMRLAGFAAVTLGFAAAAKLLRKQEGSAGNLAPVMSAAWALAATFALSVEINDYFMAPFASAEGYSVARTVAEFRSIMTGAVAWLMASVLLGAMGSRSANSVLRYVSVGIAAVSVIVAAIVCSMWQPDYSPVLNFRSVTLVLCAALALANARLNATALAGMNFVLRGAFVAAGLLLIFQLITVELWQGIYYNGDDMAEYWRTVYHRQLALPAAWMTLGLLYTGLGRWRKSAVTSAIGLLLAAVASVTGFFLCWNFVPIAEFSLLLNYRAGTLLLLATGIATATRFGFLSEPWRTKHSATLRVVGGGAGLTLIFQLLTIEPWDYFTRLQSAITIPDSDYAMWSNARQLAVSSVWVVYSLTLTAAGFLRRNRALRIAAIALFGITILKVFLYDLSFLTTLYRIFSFIGLGAVLLGISYFYQRFKDRIFGAE